MNEHDRTMSGLISSLQERAKELNCLYEVEQVLSRFDLPLEQAFAKVVERLNKLLPKRQFILMGPGRLESRGDIKLGANLTYSDINNTAMSVEIARKTGNYVPDLSQGSHFFHNLLSFRVLYISVEHYGPYRIDWEWLGPQPVVQSTGHVTQVRLPKPLEIRVDGAGGRGVIQHRG